MLDCQCWLEVWCLGLGSCQLRLYEEAGFWGLGFRLEILDAFRAWRLESTVWGHMGSSLY